MTEYKKNKDDSQETKLESNMTEYIAKLAVSLNDKDETELIEKGFTQINVNLNDGLSSNPIYLWYKKAKDGAITRIQFSFSDDMTESLSSEGFHKINKNLNEGVGGDKIYLWYFKGSSQYNIPIVDLQVTTEPSTEAQNFLQGWERLACDLNRNTGGSRIHLWVKRETQTFICDITATAGFKNDEQQFSSGYIRVDEDTNRDAGGEKVFIWYRQTTDAKRSLKDLKIGTTIPDYQRVGVNLNLGTEGKEHYLWYKRDGSNDPISLVSVIDGSAKDPFEKAGIQVDPENLNEGNRGVPLFLCFYNSSQD